MKNNEKKAEEYNQKGIEYKKIGKLPDAIKSYRRAIALNPKSSAARFNLAISLNALGKLDAAISSYKAAIKLNPSNAAAHSNIGNVFHAQGKIDDAISSYRRAYKIDSSNASYLNNLGNSLVLQGNLDEAILIYYKIIHVDGIDYPRTEKFNAVRSILKMPYGALRKEIIFEIDSFLKSFSWHDIPESQRLFSLANLRVHKGEFESASKLFIAANEARLKDIPRVYFAQQEKKWKSSYFRALNQTVRSGDFDVKAPKFLIILGPSRSGKTTIERLISTSKFVLPRYEAVNFQVLRSVQKQLDKGREIPDAQKNSLAKDLFYLRGVRHLDEKYLVTSTNPHLIHYISALGAILGHLKIILVERDVTELSVDMYTSEYSKGNRYSYSFKEIKKYIKNYEAVAHVISRNMPKEFLRLSAKGDDLAFNEKLELVASFLDLPMLCPNEHGKSYRSSRTYYYSIMSEAFSSAK
ncbi:tetratricopeptide repeat protein [Rhodovulum sp. YNF3179]|uniref:tetratricopeptide repeat protein n=1 Tax=Rhodovulum sp. YNF3179 TaxID=3425127 RepID=UPI003D341699